MKFTATLAIFAFTTSACCAGLTSSAPVDGEALERRTAIAVPAPANPPYCPSPQCQLVGPPEGCRCRSTDKRSLSSPSIGEAHEKRTSSGPSRRSTNCPPGCLSLPGGYCIECPKDPHDKRSTAHPNELPGRGPEKRSLLNGEALKRREITASLASSDRLLLNRESNPPSVGDDPSPPHFSCPKGCLYLPGGGLCIECPGDPKVRRAIAPPIELPRRV
ncbi:hypothetical protein E6O75_ATG00605 [Venturia nashicola]|uniref:Secreted protein n=1 Tax=Venturia nashicola TaxID=86259 RepID=A0A4Z1PU59_9PEZI|nr:hypothetical protein E6O75_ATG00605 [Venturia nashicola]